MRRSVNLVMRTLQLPVRGVTGCERGCRAPFLLAEAVDENAPLRPVCDLGIARREEQQAAFLSRRRCSLSDPFNNPVVHTSQSSDGDFGIFNDLPLSQ